MGINEHTNGKTHSKNRNVDDDESTEGKVIRMSKYPINNTDGNLVCGKTSNMNQLVRVTVYVIFLRMVNRIRPKIIFFVNMNKAIGKWQVVKISFSNL